MREQFLKNGAYKPEFESDNCGVGFIVDTRGKKSHKMIDDGLHMLHRMAHRGAVGFDDETGDGAGIKFEMPHKFFKEIYGEVLPNQGDYAVGMIFLPMMPTIRFECMAVIEQVIEASDFDFMFWRNVPLNTNASGRYARSTLPEIQQIFIHRNKVSKEDFNRALYILRKKIDQKIQMIDSDYVNDFYICSLSPYNIIYKGLLLADQMKKFYCDLQDSRLKTSYIIVHQRYSTNTSPNWKLAHPFKYIAHNGEINTIQGNIQKFKSKREDLRSKAFGERLKCVNKIIEDGVSDSANLDNIVELFTLGGRSILHALAMVIPEPWENRKDLDQDIIDFYEYHSNLIEPWDGPATIIFSDDKNIGAKLDRNGLRPARYYVLDHQVILASEAGVIDVDDHRIIKRGKIKPGEFFAVDLASGQTLEHHAILKTMTSEDYRKILKNNEVILPNTSKELKPLDSENLEKKLITFGYTEEEQRRVIAAMANNSKEAILSMGTDTPLAMLSKDSCLLFDYFKQLFAQVTNPAIDPIREKNVMSLRSTLGHFNGLIDGKSEDKDSHYMTFEHPILDNQRMDQIKSMEGSSFRSITIPMTFDADLYGEGLEKGIDLLCKRVEKAIKNHYNVIVLSDRAVNKFVAPIPSVLAVSAVNTFLLKNKMRRSVDLVLETGEARTAMHVALLFGYGATLVNPYLALESIEDLTHKNLYIENHSLEENIKNYIDALEKGLLKILSKMGISTLNSYIGAQLFEIIGLDKKVVSKYFNGTSHTISGIDLDILAREVYIRHENAYFENKQLSFGGELHYRKESQSHLMTPDVIAKLQQACRQNDQKVYDDYKNLLNNQNEQPITIRGLLSFKSEREPIPIDSVQPVEEIMKKFVTGAMSFGSLSKEAHETLAKAMNEIGAASNSGEGGEDPERYYTDKKSKIKQVAAGRFGVTISYLNDAEEIQIKVSQGAKPGEGGHLPGDKVVGKVAEIRHAIEGLPLISPPPHHDIYSIEDLEQLIYDLKASNPTARISVKLVSRAGIGTIAAGVVKGHADMILVSGHDGGTGAAPITSIKNAGVPWEIGLSETHQTLLMNNLRKKITLQVDGQMRTGKDVLIATLLGAEEYGFATAPLIVSGCIMMRKCHTNKCPVGVATQDPTLRQYFKGKPEHIINYFRFIANEVRAYLATLGFSALEDLVGRSDLLFKNTKINHWKIGNIDLSEILFKPELPRSFGSKYILQKESKEKSIDDELIEGYQKNQKDTEMQLKNTHRSVGTKLSSYLTKNNLTEKKTFRFTGTAGQSFGAFLSVGLSFELKGDANDYVGKGLSGGKITIKHPLKTEKTDLLVGNTSLYGATKGKLFINGEAGERFAVRNSGAISVVEGLGNHGCEYMTNGLVLILGKVGENFAAGMTGGIAYILNQKPAIEKRINTDIVTIKQASHVDHQVIYDLVEQHFIETESLKAKRIMDEWEYYKRLFIRVSNPKFDEILKKKKIQLIDICEVKAIG